MTKRIGFISLIVVLPVLLVLACGDSGDKGSQRDATLQPDADTGPEIVEFTDPNLEGCVRDHIRKPQGDILPADVQNLLWLECNDLGIESVEGLQYFAGLEYLSLWENKIFDLTPLSDLTALRTLQLGNNGILDTTPLSGLRNLTRLGLAINNIAALSPLSALLGLEYLNLDRNRITIVDPLNGLLNLKWLTIEYNTVGESQVLDGLEARGVQVYATGRNRQASFKLMPAVDLAARQPAVDRPGRLAFEARAAGQVALKYEVDGVTYNVFSIFPGTIVLDGDTFLYRFEKGTVVIGKQTDLGSEVCTGAFAGVCRIDVGRKEPTGKGPYEASGRAALPVFTAVLILSESARTVTGAWIGQIETHDLGTYASSDNSIVPYVLASPNQFDAGSCLFMATTGAVEVLMNQRIPVDQIAYEGDTDLSERYLMNASELVPGFVVPYSITDVSYTYNHFGGALLNRDYRFTAGYIKELSNGTIVAADPSEEGAYFSCYYNWLDELPDGWRNMLVPTPGVERTLVFVDPTLDEYSVWDVGLANDDVIERIKYEIRTKKAPVVVVYNHYLYWHSALVVGYDDNKPSGNCPFVQSTLDYFRDEGATSYVTKIERQMAAEGGCSTQGVFFVRDSIYDGTSAEPSYSYSDQYNFVKRYSKRIIEHSYNWPKYLGNHMYTLHRRPLEQ